MLRASAFYEELECDGLAVLDDFLTPDELAAITRELQFTHFWHSSVVRYNGREDSPAYFSSTRVSQTSGQVWFGDELNECLAKIEDRLAILLRTSRDRFEEWQATQYQPGDHFDYHVDCGNWAGSSAGERRRSMILYVEAPAEGGQTRFRALNRTIEPAAGRLLVWNNLLPSGKCNFAMIHAGLPVRSGCKTVFVSWERERRLRSEE